MNEPRKRARGSVPSARTNRPNALPPSPALPTGQARASLQKARAAPVPARTAAARAPGDSTAVQEEEEEEEEEKEEAAATVVVASAAAARAVVITAEGSTTATAMRSQSSPSCASASKTARRQATIKQALKAHKQTRQRDR